MYRWYSFASIRAYDSTSGKKSISSPRIFRVQQISSSVVTTCISASASTIFARISASFSATVFPVYFTSSSNAGFSESGGLSVQISSIRSTLYSMHPSCFLAISSYSCPSSMDTTLPSNPIFSPFLRLLFRNASSVGTPGSPIFMSSTVVP